MAGFRIVSEKGQLSIEYLLVLIMMFAYLSIVIFPVMDISSKSAQDVSNFASAKFSSDKLANAVDQICTGAEFSTRWLVVEVPAGVKIEYNSVGLGYTEYEFEMESAFDGTSEDITIGDCTIPTSTTCVCNDVLKKCRGAVYSDCRLTDQAGNPVTGSMAGNAKYRLQLTKHSAPGNVTISFQ